MQFSLIEEYLGRIASSLEKIEKKLTNKKEETISFGVNNIINDSTINSEGEAQQRVNTELAKLTQEENEKNGKNN